MNNIMDKKRYNEIKEHAEQFGVLHVHNYDEYREACNVIFNERMVMHNKKLNALCYVSWELTYEQLCDKDIQEKLKQKSIIQFCIDNWNKPVRVCYDRSNEIYTLVGLEKTEEDYYYILQRNDGSKRYETCVSKCEPV
jgi:hypothetical protein